MSQSGAFAGAPLTHGAERGIACRYAVASGNEADIALSEYLDMDAARARLVRRLPKVCIHTLLCHRSSGQRGVPDRS